MELLRSISLRYIPWLLTALLFASGCKKSDVEASDTPRQDQATPSDTVNAVFGLVRHYDDDSSSEATEAASSEAHRRLIDDLEAHKETLSEEEKDVARFFLDAYRGGVLLEMLYTQRLVEIVNETPHGDAVEVRTKVASAGTQQVFLFELRKKGANWVVEDFKSRGVPEGVYARWHKETGK